MQETVETVPDIAPPLHPAGGGMRPLGKARALGAWRPALLMNRPRSAARSHVAQVANLPYRRLAVGGPAGVPNARGLSIRDTADCQSALQVQGFKARSFLSGNSPHEPAKECGPQPCSAGCQPAVSPTWQSADQQVFQTPADSQSAIQQTASLRYRFRRAEREPRPGRLSSAGRDSVG